MQSIQQHKNISDTSISEKVAYKTIHITIFNKYYLKL